MVERSYAHRSLIDKLGVRPGHRLSVLRMADGGRFRGQLVKAGADVSAARRKESDLIFLGVRLPEEVAQLAALERYLVPDGAVWVVYPKARTDIRESDVIAAGVEAGFVDNKVVSFSETHTALRFVIPMARRPKAVR